MMVASKIVEAFLLTFCKKHGATLLKEGDIDNAKHELRLVIYHDKKGGYYIAEACDEKRKNELLDKYGK